MASKKPQLLKNMARITKNKSFSGIIGNVVFREVGGKLIAQSKSGPIKQTKATQLSGSEFRQCSSWAKRLRLGLASFLDKQTDGLMYRRFTGQLYAALQTNTIVNKGERTPLNSDMNLLSGFEFNSHSPFTNYFAPAIMVTLYEPNQVRVTMPAFSPTTAVRFAENTSQAELLLYVMATNLDQNTTYSEAYTLIPISKTEETIAETVWTTPALPSGQVVLVCAKLLFYHTNKFTEKTYVNSKDCNPAMLVKVEHT